MGRLERSQKGAGLMREAHGDGNFASVGAAVFRGLLRRQEKDETREILGVVLNIAAQDDGAVACGRTAAGNRGGGFVCPLHHFANAAGGVLGRDALEFGICGEEILALRQSHRVRRH